MAIDIFAHVLPARFCRDLFKHWPTPEQLQFSSMQTDLQKTIKCLDKFGIDTQVVTLPLPMIWPDMPVKMAVKVTRLANDAVASIAEKSRNRLLGVGTIPIVTEETLDETERCVKDLGLKGVQFFSNVGGQPIDNPEFLPLYEKMIKLNCPIWIHPQALRLYSWLTRNSLDRTLGYDFDISVAMARLAYGGIFRRFPKLKFIVHHLGSMIPFMDARIKWQFESVKKQPGMRGMELDRDVMDYLKMFYVDTAVQSFSMNVFMRGYEFYGSKHILYGSDYPFGPEQGEARIRETLRLVKMSPISQDEQIDILERNAMRLLKI